ncbi:MAG: hypothetical protein C3F15_14260 [Holophagae bacterium]|nr:MAG: hypothetical protein C3F15_14260 [Holophagae bacterium]
MNFTWSGLALYRMDMIIAFRPTDLPEPVKPPISRCGIRARSAKNGLPRMSTPRLRVSSDWACWNSGASSRVRRRMTSGSGLGTSMPTVARPGMRSMRTDSVRRASARSSARFWTAEIFTPGSRRNS